MAKRRQMVNRGNTCAVPECDDEAYSLGLCSACYARMRYWNDRPVADKMHRMKQLKRCESSLDMQLGNVKRLKRKTG